MQTEVQKRMGGGCFRFSASPGRRLVVPVGYVAQGYEKSSEGHSDPLEPREAPVSLRSHLSSYARQ